MMDTLAVKFLEMLLEFADVEGFDPRWFEEHMKEQKMLARDFELWNPEFRKRSEGGVEEVWRKTLRADVFKVIAMCIQDRRTSKAMEKTMVGAEASYVDKKTGQTKSYSPILQKQRTMKALVFSDQHGGGAVVPPQVHDLEKLYGLFRSLFESYGQSIIQLKADKEKATLHGEPEQTQRYDQQAQQQLMDNYYTLNALTRYSALFLQLRCVPKQNPRDILGNSESSQAERKEQTSYDVFGQDVMARGDHDLDLPYFFDLFLATMIDQGCYDCYMREFFNDMRSRVLDLHERVFIDINAKRYMTEGFVVTQLMDLPRELFMTTAVRPCWGGNGS